jgi:hypothetical protein
MTIRITVGLGKQIGLPDFGSLGSNCSPEFEASASLLEHDLAASISAGLMVHQFTRWLRRLPLNRGISLSILAA